MSEGTYTPNRIPWSGSSMAVPAQAVTEMRKGNQMWTAMPLEECQRTCRMIDNGAELCCSECDCRHGYDDQPNYCMGCGAKVIDNG